jgi:hypothetical protein
VAGWIWRLYHATEEGRLFNYPVQLSSRRTIYYEPELFPDLIEAGQPARDGIFSQTSPIRRKNALQRAREKSASTCFPRLMHPITGQLLP